MASTNEDVVVLATAPLGADRLLIMRHLPDRGTIEIGWWEREESGSIVPGPAVLELAAEAVELGAVARLCEELAGTRWDAAGEGERLAETASLYRWRPRRGRAFRERGDAGQASRGR